MFFRAVLRNVSPMVIRFISVPDSLHLHEVDEAFRAVIGWDNVGLGKPPRICSNGSPAATCGDDFTVNAGGRITAKTLFGEARVSNPHRTIANLRLPLCQNWANRIFL